jgi:hypothetical protein
LPAERNTEPLVDERSPEQRLGWRDIGPHFSRASSEQGLATMTTLSGTGVSAQRSLPSPAKRPGPSPLAQALCQAPAARCLALPGLAPRVRARRSSAATRAREASVASDVFADARQRLPRLHIRGPHFEHAELFVSATRE